MMTDTLPRDFIFLFICSALLLYGHKTHALCAKLGSIFIVFVGIVNKSAFCVIHCLQLDKIKRFNVGKENSSKQHDTIHNTNVTKDASGASKFLFSGQS